MTAQLNKSKAPRHTRGTIKAEAQSNNSSEGQLLKLHWKTGSKKGSDFINWDDLSGYLNAFSPSSVVPFTLQFFPWLVGSWLLLQFYLKLEAPATKFINTQSWEDTEISASFTLHKTLEGKKDMGIYWEVFAPVWY